VVANILAFCPASLLQRKLVTSAKIA
jgi:hypothetical protein